jgi:hypothetical protein
MFQGKPKWDFYARDQFLIGVINYVAGQLRVDGEAVSGETGMPVHQPQATSQSQPVFTQPVAQAMWQVPPPTTQYPGTVVPPQAPMPTQQPMHITSEVDDLPW